MAGLGGLTGPAKLNAVTDLMGKLSDDITSKNLVAHQRDAALEELKVYGRDPRNADPIFSRKGITTLTRHAFDSSSKTTSRNALKVLCNTLLIEPKTRQMFVDLGYEDKTCADLKTDSWEDEFLLSRLIFLTTYGTNVNLLTLIDQHSLADDIIHNLSRHARQVSEGSAGKTKADPIEDMALTETAKLLFNVAHFCPERCSSFTAAIPHILVLLTKLDVVSPNSPLSPPFGPLVNAMLNLEINSTEVHGSLFPTNEPNAVADRLVYLLDLSMKAYTDEGLEQTVTPLFGVIRKVYDTAPEHVQKHIQEAILPTEQDRQDVLGRGSTLSSKLLQNTTNPLTPQLRDAISHLLFELSDKDASKFVENVGYGFASGFLFQNNIPVPENASEADTGVSAGEARKPVNPVTGQFLDSEKFPDVPEMTEEEKEREAERLFVLFERLKKNGLIQVQNPVVQAVQEGRFEELPDEENDSVKD